MKQGLLKAMNKCFFLIFSMILSVFSLPAFSDDSSSSSDEIQILQNIQNNTAALMTKVDTGVATLGGKLDAQNVNANYLVAGYGGDAIKAYTFQLDKDLEKSRQSDRATILDQYKALSSSDVGSAIQSALSKVLSTASQTTSATASSTSTNSLPDPTPRQLAFGLQGDELQYNTTNNTQNIYASAFSNDAVSKVAIDEAYNVKSLVGKYTLDRGAGQPAPYFIRFLSGTGIKLDLPKFLLSPIGSTKDFDDPDKQKYLIGLRQYASMISVVLNNLYTLYYQRVPRKELNGKSITETEYNLASYRLTKYDDNDPNNWFKQTINLSTEGIERQQLYLMAEQRYESFQLRQSIERLNLTMSAMLAAIAHTEVVTAELKAQKQTLDTESSSSSTGGSSEGGSTP